MTAPRPTFPTGAILVTVTNDLRVRSHPWVGDDSTKYDPLLPPGTLLYVVKGPVAGSGYWWYRVRLIDGPFLDGGTERGWVAATDHDGEPWVSWYLDRTGRAAAAVPALPEPEGRVTGAYRERTDPESGEIVAAWELVIDNWTAYRQDLFVPMSVLEPCAGTTTATRTWLEVVDADGSVMLRCDVAGPDDLARLWVPTRRFYGPAYPLRVRLWDRATNRVAVSDAIGGPGPSPTP